MSQQDSPPVAADKEVSLVDQVGYVIYGHPTDDVLAVAVGVVMQCIVQRTHSREGALRYLDQVYWKLAEEIDHDYEAIRVSVEVPQQ